MAKQTAKELTITLTRSTIGTIEKQRATLRALGLKRIGQSVTKHDTPTIRGMLSCVGHLVSITEAD